MSVAAWSESLHCCSPDATQLVRGLATLTPPAAARSAGPRLNARLSSRPPVARAGLTKPMRYPALSADHAHDAQPSIVGQDGGDTQPGPAACEMTAHKIEMREGPRHFRQEAQVQLPHGLWRSVLGKIAGASDRCRCKLAKARI